jgi:hypothetical protein
MQDLRSEIQTALFVVAAKRHEVRKALHDAMRANSPSAIAHTHLALIGTGFQLIYH